MDQQRIIPYLKFLPLTGFLLYARIYGLTTQAWQGAFITAGILAAGITTFLLFHPIILDRLMLGVNLFFFVGASAFMFNIMPILELYGSYKGAAFFINIAIIGIITTLFSPTGFIGVYHHNKAAVTTASYKLLAGTFACFGLSLALNSFNLIVSAGLPFIALRMLRDALEKDLIT